MWFWIGLALVAVWAVLYFALGVIECAVHAIVLVGGLLLLYGAVRALAARRHTNAA